MRILVSAGEVSGDRHAAAVVRALWERDSSLEVVGIGGSELEAEGARLITHVEGLSAIGLAEAAHAVPRHVRLLRRLERELGSGAYDLVLLVDYPGFHLRLAERATRAGVPVLYYVAPQLWAWGTWRLDRLRRSVRHLAVVLPFEQSFFGDRGVPTTFVGHPLLDEEKRYERASARQMLGLDDAHPAVAVLPGSRPSEVRRLAPVFRAAVERLVAEVPSLTVLVAERQQEEDQWYGVPGVQKVTAGMALAAADVGLVKSGTATLEAALADLPMIVAYRMHPLTYAVARRLVHVPYVSLVNLVANGPVVPEYLQQHARPEPLARAVGDLLGNRRARQRQRDGFRALRERLGTPGAASRVADLALGIAA